LEGLGETLEIPNMFDLKMKTPQTLVPRYQSHFKELQYLLTSIIVITSLMPRNPLFNIPSFPKLSFYVPLLCARGRGRQARTGRGIHGLPKVSYGPAMSNPNTPCGRATLQTALRLFGGWPAHRVGGLQPSSSPLNTPSHTGLKASD
jgi:hypothetical protein